MTAQNIPPWVAAQDAPEWIEHPPPAWVASAARTPSRRQPVMTARARMQARGKGHAAYVRAHLARAVQLEAKPFRTAADQAAIRRSRAAAAAAVADLTEVPVPPMMRAAVDRIMASGRHPSAAELQNLIW